MLDINYIRENPEELKQAIADKQMDPAIVDRVLELDNKRRDLIAKVEAIRKDANAHNATIKGRKPTDEEIATGKAFKTKLQNLEPDLKQIEDEFNKLMLYVPNPASSDTPVGKDESSNVEVRKVGKIREFDFQPKEHWELAENLGMFDSERAVAIGGRRAYILKGDLFLLEQALLQYAMQLMIQKGFTPMSVPWMVNKEALWGTGYFPWGIEDHYTTQDDQGLIGTAEVSLTAYHQNEILNEKDLPIKLVGISPCFRREVGSYGKDTKGFFRVHQFTKVEQVVLTVADEDLTKEWHEKMVGFSEELLQALDLPYHVLAMCTGDMGAGQRKKYDIEVWFPGQKVYRETHSASYFNDFQARRLNMKYRAKDGSVKHVYTLNNTVAATPRLLAAVIENYQQADGTIKVPEVLQRWMQNDIIAQIKGEV
ncbi:MAG TPA: serine--tRNA ligase [Patescibacteria group bacterium]|nr:serine--tRNA ligase [Patescibacteria group bacterium]